MIYLHVCSNVITVTEYLCLFKIHVQCICTQRHSQAQRETEKESVSLYLDFLYGRLSQAPFPVSCRPKSWCMLRDRTDLNYEHHGCLLLSHLLRSHLSWF